MRYLPAYWDDVKKVLPAIGNIDALNGKTVAVTGATGLICSGVVDILHYLNTEKKAGVRLLLLGRSEARTAARFPHMVPGEDYRFVRFDATKAAEADVAADYIIHGASNANPAAYVAQPVETMEANFIGLNELMKAAKRCGTKRVLYLSSSEVYGQKDGMEPFRENDLGYLDILNPRAAYPSSKRAAETLCIAYASEYGIDPVIVRPGHVYGPAITAADNRATAQFTRNAAKKEQIVMKSAGTQLRSYCYSLDCASAILTVLINGASGEAYNISNPDSIITIGEIAAKIAQAAGMDLAFENPADAEAKGYNLMSNSSLASEKLEALGWRAFFSPEEGADRCVQYYEA